MLINKYMFSGIYKSTNNYYSINHAYELPLPRGGYCGDQKNYRTKPNPTVHLSSNELHEPFLSNTVGPVNNLFNRLQQSTQPKETNLPDSHIKSGFSLHEYLDYYTTAPAGAANPSSSQPVIYPTKPTRPGQSEYYSTAPAGSANPSSSQPVIYPTKPTRPGQSEYYEKLENERCLSCGDIPNNKITDTDAKYYCTKPYYVCGLSNPFFEK